MNEPQIKKIRQEKDDEKLEVEMTRLDCFGKWIWYRLYGKFSVARINPKATEIGTLTNIIKHI